MKRVTLFVAVVCLTASLANANLLINGDFNDPATGDPPTGWSVWAWGDGWANHENNAPVTYDGSYYFVAGAPNNGGGGINQIVAATAGTEYQLTVLSGADAWWQPHGAMTMFFLDSSDVQVGLATRQTVDPAVYGWTYDQPHPWESYTLTAIAPANTAKIKVEFDANWNTGSTWFENADLTVVPEPGTAALVALGSALLIGYRSRRNKARA
jgi:hypothetical protein